MKMSNLIQLQNVYMLTLSFDYKFIFISGRNRNTVQLAVLVLAVTYKMYCKGPV